MAGFWGYVASVINIFQLLMGLASILSYIGMSAIKKRFFPLRVFTLAGQMDASLTLGNYHTLQAAQGMLSTASALLFLGRNTFCVTRRVYVNSRPGHQFCVEWSVGIGVATMMACATSVLCIWGCIEAVRELSKNQGNECISAFEEEQLCSGALATSVLQAEPMIFLKKKGIKTCTEYNWNTFVPLFYVVILSLSLVAGVGSVVQGRNLLVNSSDE